MSENDQATQTVYSGYSGSPRGEFLWFVEEFLKEYCAEKGPEEITEIRNILFHLSDNSYIGRYVWGCAFTFPGGTAEPLLRLLKKKLKKYDLFARDKYSPEFTNLCGRAGLHAENERWNYCRQQVASRGYDLRAPCSDELIKKEYKQMPPGWQRVNIAPHDLGMLINPYISILHRLGVIVLLAKRAFVTFILVAPIVAYLLFGVFDKIKADSLAKFWLATSVTIELWGVMFVLFSILSFIFGKGEWVNDSTKAYSALLVVIMIVIMAFVRHLAFPT